jgi:hypothetical protein
MVHRAGPDESHIGRYHYISRYLSPGKLKRVHLRPDVGASASDAIIPRIGIEFDSALFRGFADITVLLKDPYFRGVRQNKRHQRDAAPSKNLGQVGNLRADCQSAQTARVNNPRAG